MVEGDLGPERAILAVREGSKNGVFETEMMSGAPKSRKIVFPIANFTLRIPLKTRDFRAMKKS